MAYLRDDELTKTGFETYKEAWLIYEATKAKLGQLDPTGTLYRVRIRQRTRTGKWDVVVKTKREAE